MLTLDQVTLPLVAILRGITPEEAPAIADVLLEGGIEVVEVTINSPNPFESLSILIDRCGDKMLVGCGTVLSPEVVDQVADAGGGLVVSPNFNPAVVKRTKERDMISAPGCLTPTEMFAALEAGADIVKAFPGNIATPSVIKGYRAVLPTETKIVVTGGVDTDTIPAYVDAGAYGLGLGSSLYKPCKEASKVAVDLEGFVKAYKRAII